MTKEDWLINLEDVSSRIDAEQVTFVCSKYGANDIYELAPSHYQEVLNELFLYEVDTND